MNTSNRQKQSCRATSALSILILGSVTRLAALKLVEIDFSTPILNLDTALGFQIDWRDGNGFGGVSNGEISMFFQKTESNTSEITCVLNTPDADEVYAKYKKSGVEIVADITTQPWGMREFTIRDVNGHCLRIGHVDESKADHSDFVQ